MKRDQRCLWLWAAGILFLMQGSIDSVWPNPAHEKLIAMSEVDRTQALALVVEGSGHPCQIVVRTFYQGFDAKGNAFWNVECRDGQSYVVQIKNERDGSTRVLNCRTLHAAGGGACFTKPE